MPSVARLTPPHATRPPSCGKALTSLALREDLPDAVRSRAEALVHAWSFTVLVDGAGGTSLADLSAAGGLSASASGSARSLSPLLERRAAAAGMGLSAAVNTARVASSSGGSAAEAYRERYQVRTGGGGDWD